MDSEKEKFLKSFENKLKKKIDENTLSSLKGGEFLDDNFSSSDYVKFREEKLPKSFSTYEKVCNYSQKILKIEAGAKQKEEIEKNLNLAHINTTSGGVLSLSLLLTLIFFFFGIGLFLYSKILGIGIILLGIISYFALQSVPKLLAEKSKVNASDQIIIGVFYIVSFMRFSSNLELAINFAAQHLTGPLSLDFKRILWELDNAKYPSIKKAFDVYLEKWRTSNLDFLEAIYLIESSLYESEEFRRISLLDKSLDIILRGNYEKVLHFAQELREKVNVFNMIGVVLPILGLIILPLAAALGNPRETFRVIFILYNLFFPLLVCYFGFKILFNRPTSASTIKPQSSNDFKKEMLVPFKIFKKTYNISPKIPALLIFFLFFSIGIFPLLVQSFGLTENLNLKFESIFGDSPFGLFQEYKYVDEDGGYELGPYGFYPSIFSLFIPLSFAFSIGYYLKLKYRRLIGIHNQTKDLEVQFPSATFQLGNRINEGISAELSFGAVADTMRGTEAGNFFSKIDSNIKFLGMDIQRAIFDKEKGAINEYPSEIVLSSMKILIQAIEKGPEIAAKTLIDLSRYLTEIHSGQERMKDLLAESLGSMKSQSSFLAPIISAVVISIVSLVTLILSSLSKKTKELGENLQSQGGIQNLLGDSIPTYLFQSVVGIYITILIAVLVYMVTNLETGNNPIYTKYEIGNKIIGGIRLYSIITFLGILFFTYLGTNVLGNLA